MPTLAAAIVPVMVLADRSMVLLVSVWLASARTSVPLAFGALSVRVVPVAIKAASNCNFLAGSRLSVRKVAASGRLIAVTVAPKATVGLLNVVLPKAPATAEPTAIVVVDPDTPSVPMLTALVAPAVVAPAPSPTVEAAVDEPNRLAAPENVQFEPIV